MVFSAAENELIKTCYVEKGWLGTQIVQEFPGKRWNCRSIHNVIQLFKRTGSVARQAGSGRPRTARSEANKDYTEDNIQSQDNQPGTHKSQRKIRNAISKKSIHRITKELNLKAYKQI